MKAIIVDGGKASRLGYMSPKGMVRVNGIPLAGYLIARLRDLGVMDVTLIVGEKSVAAYEESEVGRNARIVIDSMMKGPLSALDGVASEFSGEDVVITTGDAFFGSLGALRGCAPGHMVALVDFARRGTLQIHPERAGYRVVDKDVTPGSVSYASAIRVNKCNEFWDDVRDCAMLGGLSIIEGLSSSSMTDVELRMVNSFWRNVNEPSDLEAVRSYLND